jgi:hypothetical protein
MPRNYFCSVSHFDFGVHHAADHPVTVAVEVVVRRSGLAAARGRGTSGSALNFEQGVVKTALNKVEPLTCRESADAFGEFHKCSQKPRCEVSGRHDNEADCDNDVHDPRPRARSEWMRIDLGIHPQ